MKTLALVFCAIATVSFCVQVQRAELVAHDVNPDAPGYVYYPGADSTGNDLTKKWAGMSPNELTKICSQTKDCVGFNSAGWLKSRIRSPDEWKTSYFRGDGQGLYFKENHVPGYVFYPGADSTGNDLKKYPGKTVQEIGEICEKNDDCVGFNSAGTLKDWIYPAGHAKWDSKAFKGANEGTYVWHNFVPGYKFYKSTDSQGYDMKKYPDKTSQELGLLCTKTIDCVGFNTAGWLKSRIIGPGSDEWTTEYFEGYGDGLFVLEDYVADFTYYHGMDIKGNDIGKFPGKSTLELGKLCRDTPDCVGFNTAGYLKRSMDGGWQTGYFRGKGEGFYRKN